MKATKLHKLVAELGRMEMMLTLTQVRGGVIGRWGVLRGEENNAPFLPL